MAGKTSHPHMLDDSGSLDLCQGEGTSPPLPFLPVKFSVLIERVFALDLVLRILSYCYLLPFDILPASPTRKEPSVHGS